MENNLTLYNKTGIFKEKKIILTSNEDIVIKLDYEANSDVDYIAKYNNVSVHIKNKQFIIKNIKPCVLHITIYATHNGEIIRNWICESLIISKVNDGYEVIPELEELKNQLKDIKDMINKLNDNVKFMEEALKQINDLEV